MAKDKDKNNNNSSNSLVFACWPQTIRTSILRLLFISKTKENLLFKATAKTSVEPDPIKITSATIYTTVNYKPSDWFNNLQ